MQPFGRQKLTLSPAPTESRTVFSHIVGLMYATCRGDVKNPRMTTLFRKIEVSG